MAGVWPTFTAGCRTCCKVRLPLRRIVLTRVSGKDLCRALYGLCIGGQTEQALIWTAKIFYLIKVRSDRLLVVWSDISLFCRFSFKRFLWTDTSVAIGRFSEAGLLEWMHFVIFRARSRSAFPGRFLSRRCFTLCIAVEVEPRIAKQYKCQYCCSCKYYCRKGVEGGKRCLCIVFWLTRRSRVRGKNTFWGIL